MPDNPYSPTNTPAALNAPDSDPASLKETGVRWRFIPTIFFSVLGTIGTVLGIVCICILVPQVISILSDAEMRNFVMEDKSQLIPVLLPPLWLGWGVSWLAAARSSWRQKWWTTVVIALIGTAFLVSACNLPLPD